MIEALRHLSVFSPAKFGDRSVHIVGCGATGSKIALSLAKLGVTNLHLHDFDIVEEHNIANQAFLAEHIGQPKVDAVADLILRAAGIEVTKHNSKVTGSTELDGIVFLLTDSMKSRKEIWEGAIRRKLRVNVMIETRMGADVGYLYTVNPCSPNHIAAWESCWYPDEKSEASACGASVSVGPTADVISGFAVWQMIRWFDETEGGGEQYDNEVLISLRPPSIITREFKK